MNPSFGASSIAVDLVAAAAVAASVAEDSVGVASCCLLGVEPPLRRVGGAIEVEADLEISIRF